MKLAVRTACPCGGRRGCPDCAGTGKTVVLVDRESVAGVGSNGSRGVALSAEAQGALRGALARRGGLARLNLELGVWDDALRRAAAGKPVTADTAATIESWAAARGKERAP